MKNIKSGQMPIKIMNQSGQGTLAFLFSCVLILSASGLLGALALALTLTEQVQYVAFSSSRGYFAGDFSKQDQEDAAEKKLTALLSKVPLLVGGIKSGWIKITPQKPGDYMAYAENGSQNVSIDRFIGVQLGIEVPILNLKLPLLGDAISAPGGSFKSTINSFLLREPTYLECTEFYKGTFSALRGLNAGYGANNTPNPEELGPTLDNGC